MPPPTPPLDPVAAFVGLGCLLAFICMMAGFALIPLAAVFWIVRAAVGH